MEYHFKPAYSKDRREVIRIIDFHHIKVEIQMCVVHSGVLHTRNFSQLNVHPKLSISLNLLFQRSIQARCKMRSWKPMEINSYLSRFGKHLHEANILDVCKSLAFSQGWHAKEIISLCTYRRCYAVTCIMEDIQLNQASTATKYILLH